MAATLMAKPTSGLRLPKCASARRVPRSVRVAASLQTNAPATRRQLLQIAATVAAVNAATVLPSRAFLGFGEDASREEAYSKETNAVLGNVKAVINMSRDEPDRDEKIRVVRNDINSWVAKYRRDPKFSGRPSFSNTYSVLNALAGQFNSFGTTSSIPKKRLERIVKELGDAELLLSRGR